MSNTNTKKLIVFLDAIGRTLLGKVASETDTSISIENPSIVHVQPNPANNQLQLQIIPLFFKEFLANRDEDTVWHFNKNTITLCGETEFAAQFMAQYEHMWTPLPPPEPKETKVVKLFDEE